MKTFPTNRGRGFTLVETVIAIGVLAVLLTGFMYVFAPAADGIKRSISIQTADRLTSTLEQELATLRSGGDAANGDYKTAFGRAFSLIKDSDKAESALMVYQYRGNPAELRPDGTPKPVADVAGKIPGQHYVLQTMMRVKGDGAFLEDVDATEGNIYYVKCTQLVFKAGQLELRKPGGIQDPVTGTEAKTADEYPAAVIAFAADFYVTKAKTRSYFGSGFSASFEKASKPLFSRNLAVRR